MSLPILDMGQVKVLSMLTLFNLDCGAIDIHQDFAQVYDHKHLVHHFDVWDGDGISSQLL